MNTTYSNKSGGNINIIIKALAISLLFITSVLCFSVQAHASDDAKRILSLVDYIGGDYRNAISNGEIINTAEYDEMLEFSSQVKNLYSKLKASEGDKGGVGPELSELSTLIENKSPVYEVESISAEIKNKLIVAYGIVPHPDNAPSFAEGRELYGNYCAQCHGATGAGDGQLSSGLEPRPAAFSDPEFSDGLSPFKVYNTTSFGIEGTGMPSFPMLSDQEKWDVSFYVLSLGVEPLGAQNDAENVWLPPELTDYRALATTTNAEIKDKLAEINDNEAEQSMALALIRSGGPTDSSVSPQSQSLADTSSMVDETLTLYSEGDKEGAYKMALDAYLTGYEKVESQIAVKDQALNTRLENRFASLRGAIESGKPVSEVETIGAEINADLITASNLFTNGKQVSSMISFVNSFAIIVREGLEAILIIAAIIAFLGATGARSSIKYIHYGWIAAIIAGLLTWVLARTVISISGAQREIIEGITALTAAAVLFYVSYWLITKIEVQKWKSYIKGKVESAVSKKSVFALAGVSFFAVYREAFETVLFYQALWYQAESTQAAVLWGFAAGVAVLVVLYFVVFRLALTIPIKYFFSVTSAFLYFLSFILLGKGIRELQEAGVVGITPLEFLPTIDVLGVYPTLETAVPQGIVILAFIFAVFWITYVSREREKKEIAVSLSRIADDMKSMSAAFDHIKGHIVEWKRCKDIDMEARDLDKQIHDVITHVDELEDKLDNFYDIVSKNKEPGTKLN